MPLLCCRCRLRTVLGIAPQPPTPDLCPVFQAMHGEPQDKVVGMGLGAWRWVSGLAFGPLRHTGRYTLAPGTALMRAHGPGPVPNINSAECATKQILDPLYSQTPYSWLSSPPAPLPFGLVTKHLSYTDIQTEKDLEIMGPRSYSLSPISKHGSTQKHASAQDRLWQVSSNFFQKSWYEASPQRNENFCPTVNLDKQWTVDCGQWADSGTCCQK